MPAKKSKATKSRANDTRSRVRELTLNTFRKRNLSLDDVPGLVTEVLDRTVAVVDESIPASGKNVLREVFDGLQDGVHSVASAGSATAKELRERGRTMTGKTAPAAAKRVRAANEDFLGAVKDFASKASGEVRDELDSLVNRAKRLQPKVTDSARKVASAADGRLMELGGETVRAGARAARRTAGAIAMGASGFLEGLAEVMKPRAQAKRPTKSKRPAVKKAAKPTPKKKTAKRKR